MARIEQTADGVTVRLATWEKIAGLRGDIQIPRSAVTAVQVENEPLAAVAGVRAPGLHVPGRIKIGTWRHSGSKTFAAARRGVSAVRLDLAGQRYSRLVISVDDAAGTADALR